jgi:hypothetical protein
MDLKAVCRGGVIGVYTAHGLVAGSCGQGTQISGSIKREKSLE